jgi:hypothetical protein
MLETNDAFLNNLESVLEPEPVAMRSSHDALGKCWHIALSKRRLQTSAVTALAMILVSLPLVWPGPLSSQLAPVALVLGPVIQVILNAPHHFLGGQSKTSTHILAATIISAVLGFLCTLANPWKSAWVGAGLLLLCATAVAVVNRSVVVLRNWAMRQII